MSKGTSPLVSKVQCQSTPKLLKSASWKETFKAAKKSSHVPSKTSNVETKNPDKGSYQTVTNSTWMLNDEYGWMYEVWERKGLMRKKGALVLREKNRVKPILSKTQKDPLQSSKITVGTGEMLRVKPLPPKPEKEPIPTPKEALVSVDYNALQADQVGDKIPNPKQRQSLPADLRQPTQNNAGRKSFDNIKKMWQHKTEDQPNSFFSPERYMKERRQSHNSERARPTAFSKLRLILVAILLSLCLFLGIFLLLRRMSRLDLVQLFGIFLLLGRHYRLVLLTSVLCQLVVTQGTQQFRSRALRLTNRQPCLQRLNPLQACCDFV